MAFTKRFWGVGKFLLLLSGLMATYFLFAVAGMQYARTARQVPVPDLSGSDPDRSYPGTHQCRLTLRLEEQRRVHPTIPSGLVAEQEPPPGITMRRQRSVRAWLSAREFAGVVPTVIGESERGARRRLEEEALVLTEVSEIQSAGVPDRHHRGPGAAPADAGHDRVCARQPRRARLHLRHARSDRRAERPRGRPTARARVPCDRRGGPPVSRLTGGDRPAPLAAGRVSDRARRIDLARGESVTIRIAPSILSADFAVLGDAIAAAERGGADQIHVDVMDGHFVPNITIGPPVVRAIKRVAHVPLDVHLMIADPDRHIEAFADAGAAMLSVHVEVLPHLHRTLTFIKSLGIKAGAVLNPSTPVSALEEIAGELDFALVMSVNPGLAARLLSRAASLKYERSGPCSTGREPGADRNRRGHRPHQRGQRRRRRCGDSGGRATRSSTEQTWKRPPVS